jgi:cardiolipin synthase
MLSDRLPFVAIMALALLLAGCFVEGDPAALATQSYDLDGQRRCGLSELGRLAHDAALGADQSRNTVPAPRMVGLRNRTGDPLLSGPQIFPAMAAHIAEAEHEVDIAMFVVDASDGYRDVVAGIGQLEQRRRAAGARQPVVVRIVVDAMKAFVNAPDDMALRAFQGIADLELDPDYVQVMIATYEHLAFGNLHTKTVVVDGRLAMIGGANIQPQHDYLDPWMDAFFVVEGDAAQTLLADFDHAWNKSRQWVCRDDDRPSCVRWDDAPEVWHPAAVLAPDLSHLQGDCVPTVALTRSAWGGFNNNVDNPQDQGVLALLDAAAERVRIQTPNLNDDAVRDAIVRALQRGVVVQLVLSMGFNDSAMNLLGGTNEEVAADLRRRAHAEASDHADKLQVRWYSQDGRTPVDGNVPGASHLKYLSVDGRIVVVGSMNMDTIAWNHSRETNLAFDHPEVTERWDAQVFEPHWQRGVPAW